jgi:hypothetical protein
LVSALLSWSTGLRQLWNLYLFKGSQWY